MEARLDNGVTGRLYVEVANNFVTSAQASVSDARSVVSDVDQLYGRFRRARDYFDVRGVVSHWFGRV